MNRIIILIILIFTSWFTSCSSSGKKNIAANQVDTSKSEIYVSKNSETKPIIKTDSSILWSYVEKVDGEIYTAFSKSHYSLYVSNSSGKIIVNLPKSVDEISGFEFEDFNGDSLKDIRIHYMCNVPSIQNLLLFDKTKKTFIIVQEFTNYPDPKPIKQTKYYYSYHRSGCADMNWDSDLFYINNFKAIRLGNISGRECHEQGEKEGIFIYKVKGEKETLVRTLSISALQKYKDYKWGFIKEYWEENYLKFLN